MPPGEPLNSRRFRRFVTSMTDTPRRMLTCRAFTHRPSMTSQPRIGRLAPWLVRSVRSAGSGYLRMHRLSRLRRGRAVPEVPAEVVETEDRRRAAATAVSQGTVAPVAMTSSATMERTASTTFPFAPSALTARRLARAASSFERCTNSTLCTAFAEFVNRMRRDGGKCRPLHRRLRRFQPGGSLDLRIGQDCALCECPNNCDNLTITCQDVTECDDEQIRRSMNFEISQRLRDLCCGGSRESRRATMCRVDRVRRLHELDDPVQQRRRHGRVVLRELLGHPPSRSRASSGRLDLRLRPVPRQPYWRTRLRLLLRYSRVARTRSATGLAPSLCKPRRCSNPALHPVADLFACSRERSREQGPCPRCESRDISSSTGKSGTHHHPDGLGG